MSADRMTETGAHQKPASKVRVTFYESSRPLIVTSPEPSDLDLYCPQDLLMASPITDAHMPAFDRQMRIMMRSAAPQPSHGGLLYYVVHGREKGTESGRDNPFRPDGDISKEADQIVEAIKSGRPLLQTATSPDLPDSPADTTTTIEPLITTTDVSPTNLSPGDSNVGSPGKGQTGANGAAPGDKGSTPGPVEVKHVTVTPTEGGHVERVVIKKKNKCKCCVIQ
ncbi:hypothetical protein GWK47_045428 [Chionoecetes opilio]|uniref:Uncharacterized protein n=1 Tax=Chionoecetes opilio TaxID=41210 RepID=A0A8J5CHL0_CHIOP|nr:hypothetical protein GWK47_045428 [Chionoecetes opilio]